MKFLNSFKVIILLCLTLGLAPYYPEPHIVGKLNWIKGGANGMQIKDWWDVLLHGFPFILLLRVLLIKIVSKNAA